MAYGLIFYFSLHELLPFKYLVYIHISYIILFLITYKKIIFFQLLSVFKEKKNVGRMFEIDIKDIDVNIEENENYVLSYGNHITVINNTVYDEQKILQAYVNGIDDMNTNDVMTIIQYINHIDYKTLNKFKFLFNNFYKPEVLIALIVKSEHKAYFKVPFCEENKFKKMLNKLSVKWTEKYTVL
ncbi:hypothetical protein [Haloplasma contractile]|uniref:Uncharacterized protein n=1 Tax=Haloplasma contractile SSD-17B TaxID=1033810 RepID=U2FKC7_9MOLU|nr:hypothetical protein [Haloplasma contractile]ERJ13265.1 hypothetical protein HLPCO_000894 [Haloplasma contractile SSD-17B]